MEHFFYVIVTTPGTGVDPPNSPNVSYAFDGEIVKTFILQTITTRGAMHFVTARLAIDEWDKQSDIELALWDGGWLKVEALPLSELLEEMAPPVCHDHFEHQIEGQA
jgi:hypothetical protein